MITAKTIFKNTTCLILILSVFSCDFSFSKSSRENNDIDKTFNKGYWKIANFTRSGLAEKQYYQYYCFTFSPNNDIGVTEGNNKYSGKWNIKSTENDDDLPETNVDFELSFEPNDKLWELAAVWQIVEIGKSKLVLNKVSDSCKKIDSLVFEKM